MEVNWAYYPNGKRIYYDRTFEMRASWSVFINDIKNIGKNWAAAIIIGGLILLPSLYAWLNIIASWDPYGNTDQIPIGIVNEDKGGTVRDKEIHVGDDLVKNLKENKSLEWHFTSREKAMDELKYGDYYAVIIIPENFSERLASVISDHPEKAVVEYYVNEKINAIAPKITEKGASAIVEKIKSNFISVVNGVIFEIFNELGIQLEEALPDIKKFEGYIFTLEENLPKIYEILNGTLSDAKTAKGLINQAEGLLPIGEKAADTSLQAINNMTQFLLGMENGLDEIEPKIDKGLGDLQGAVSKADQLINNLDPAGIGTNVGEQAIKQLNGQVNGMITSIELVENLLNQLLNEKQNMGQNSLGTFVNAVSELEGIEQNVQKMQEQISSIGLADVQNENGSSLSALKGDAAALSNRVNTFVNKYDGIIKPAVRGEITNAKVTLADARGIISGIQSDIPGIKDMLGRTATNLSTGEGVLEDVLGEYPYINKKVSQLADKIRSFQGTTDLGDIIQLLENDPNAERGFFAEPVVLNENRIFPIPNYGTGMTPFYTVLAIWVGGLLLISLLSTEVHDTGNYSAKQIYFGRLLTFLSIAYCQTLIVTLGDIFLLHVEVREPLWFVMFGLLSSTVFILIVYTLVSVFGNVGKAFAIVLLVLQIAGAGGTYPVVLLPEFFQIINPFLPFTYAIDFMREAVGGIVWSRCVRDIIFLLLFGSLAILVGTILKPIINKHSYKIVKKTKESGIIH